MTPSDLRADAHLRKTYGIDLATYEAMFLAQGGACAICLRPHKGTRRLNVDHDHKTGKRGIPIKVRGLCCMHCNKLLGWARDRPEVLRRAADYLEFHAPHSN